MIEVENMIRKILAIWAGGIVTLFFVFGANFLFPELLSSTANLLIGALIGALVFWRVLKWDTPRAFDE